MRPDELQQIKQEIQNVSSEVQLQLLEKKYRSLNLPIAFYYIGIEWDLLKVNENAIDNYAKALNSYIFKNNKPVQIGKSISPGDYLEVFNSDAAGSSIYHLLRHIGRKDVLNIKYMALFKTLYHMAYFLLSRAINYAPTKLFDSHSTRADLLNFMRDNIYFKQHLEMASIEDGGEHTLIIYDYHCSAAGNKIFGIHDRSRLMCKNVNREIERLTGEPIPYEYYDPTDTSNESLNILVSFGNKFHGDLFEKSWVLYGNGSLNIQPNDIFEVLSAT